jgi:hypothetical protein
MTSLLERLCILLSRATESKGEQPLTYADFIETVRALRSDLPAIHGRAVSGSKISKADAKAEAELVKEFYMLVRNCDGQYRHQIEELRTAASQKVKTVYLPASLKNPEQG